MNALIGLLLCRHYSSVVSRR